MLLTVETSTSTSSRKDSSDSNAMRPAMTTNADRRNPGKGKNNTMNTSSSRGLYRRLNRHREKILLNSIFQGQLLKKAIKRIKLKY